MRFQIIVHAKALCQLMSSRTQIESISSLYTVMQCFLGHIAYLRISIWKHNEIVDSASKEALLMEIIMFLSLEHCHFGVSVLIKLYIQYSIN